MQNVGGCGSVSDVNETRSQLAKNIKAQVKANAGSKLDRNHNQNEEKTQHLSFGGILWHANGRPKTMGRNRMVQERKLGGDRTRRLQELGEKEEDRDAPCRRKIENHSQMIREQQHQLMEEETQLISKIKHRKQALLEQLKRLSPENEYPSKPMTKMSAVTNRVPLQMAHPRRKNKRKSMYQQSSEVVIPTVEPRQRLRRPKLDGGNNKYYISEKNRGPVAANLQISDQDLSVKPNTSKFTWPNSRDGQDQYKCLDVLLTCHQQEQYNNYQRGRK